MSQSEALQPSQSRPIVDHSSSPSISPRPSHRRSVQFHERSSNSLPRSRRSYDSPQRQMPSDPPSPRPRDRAANDSDSESGIRSIARAGDGRDYRTIPRDSPGPDGSRNRKTAPQSSGDSRSPSPGESWFRQMAEKYGTVELENKGSVARDHLALERTFLAWLRTSLAFASIGIAITQLFRLNTTISSGSGTRRLDYSPYIGHSIPFPDPAFDNSLYIQDDQSILALLTSPHPNAMPAQTAQRLRHLGKPLGATFLGVAILILFIGFHRYFESQHWIIRGKFPASRASVAIVGLITGALIVACLVVVVTVAGGSFEKR